MQKFTFSLEKVLDVRWTAEEEAKQAYATAQQALYEQEENLRLLRQEKAELLEVPEVGVNRMQVRYWYLMELERQTDLAQSQVAHFQQAVEVALEHYIHAQKERKILERLEEKKWEEHQVEMKREEQKTLDEMGLRKLAIQ
ncbi:flagellar export protein FliJ [Enterococcus sp. LJL98]